MQFRILGPVEAVDNGTVVMLGGGKQLALFTLLLLHANEVVSTDRLVDELWTGEPPATAEKIVRNYVSLLRKQLGDRLVTRTPGYMLRADAAEIDSAEFERRIHEARAQNPAAARRTLGGALAMWSGPPLAQLAYEPFAEREAERLAELHVQALEDRIEADLQLGLDKELVPELEKLVRGHPLRERPRSLLMLALYRAGRQVDALEAYQEARKALVDELGLEPSPALQNLQRRILSHDAGLAGPPHARLAGPRRRAGLLIAAGGIALLAAGTAAAVVELAGGSAATLSRVVPNSVGVVDPQTDRIVGQVPIGSAPTGITFGSGVVWTANSGDSTVTRIDPRTLSVVKTIAVRGPPSSMAVLGPDLWVLLRYSQNGTGDAASGDAGIAQVDTGANDVFASFHLPAEFSDGFDTIAAAGRVLWAADHGVVSRVDPVSGRVTARVAVENWVAPGLASGLGSIWALGPNTVERIDPASAAVTATIPLTGNTGPGGPAPTAITVGDGAVWVTNRLLPPANIHGGFPHVEAGTVSRIDPATNAVAATIPVGHFPVAVAVGAGAVWVANQFDRSLSKIDPRTNRVVATLKLGGQPEGVAVGEGKVWVTVD